ncbi:MAG: DUF721 domain-containing protein [Candidatus Omnitrophica bacterium]|nr:DUF721 domain-containing protein [Candidatus Omnitrophota bacterium]
MKRRRAKDKTLAELVKSVISDLGKKGRVGEEEMSRAWEEVVGKSASRHARPVSLKKATLIVNVDGSSWLYELTTKKKAIVNGLSERLGLGKALKEIRFRIGEVKAK